MAEQQPNGSKVSWETYTLGQQEIHREQLDLRRELAARDQQYMDTLMAMRGEVVDRDRQHADILAEVRDSLGGMHGSLLSVTSQYDARFLRIEGDVAVLRANAIPWRRAGGLVNRKSMAAIVATAAGIVGWDGLQQMAEKWGR